VEFYIFHFMTLNTGNIYDAQHLII
jgi:hypothetical protein